MTLSAIMHECLIRWVSVCLPVRLDFRSDRLTFLLPSFSSLFHYKYTLFTRCKEPMEEVEHLRAAPDPELLMLLLLLFVL